MVHHEILAISTPFQILTSSNIGERECELSHKLIGNYNLNYNTVKKIADFVQFCGNLFVTPSGLARLHNFLTKAFISHNAAEELQNFPQNSKLRYENFRQLRYIAKTKSLSATIKKFNFSHFGTSHKEKSKPSKKNVALSQRSMNIARLRQVTTIGIFPYDLFNSSLLLDGDLPIKPPKNILPRNLKV